MPKTITVFNGEDFSHYITMTEKGAVLSSVSFYWTPVVREIYDMSTQATVKSPGKALLPFYVDSIYVDKKGKVFREYEAHRP